MTASSWNPQAALERVGHDQDLLQHMIMIFSEDAVPLLSQLRAQLQEKRLDEACRTAHSIKGLAMNFDGAQCSSAAEQIEHRCRANDRGDFEANLHQLDASIQELSHELNVWKLSRDDRLP